MRRSSNTAILKRWRAYFEERRSGNDEDTRPLNRFAADQGEQWYDHDWIEGGIFEPAEAGSAEAQVSCSP